MSAPIQTEVRGPVGLIRLTRPPVNAMGHALRVAFAEAHAAFDADNAIRAIAITGDGRIFSGGADIAEFDSGRRPPYLTEIIAQLEAGDTPVVAVLDGAAYGGGFELSLGCDYRIALPRAKLSFPEIRLGNIPGAGGTQKLPRLIGGPAALDLILSGRSVDAKEAEALGIVDRTAPDLDAALAHLAEVELPRRRVIDLAVPGDPAELEAAAAPFVRRARGAPATEAGVEAVRRAYEMPIGPALEWERETFARLNASPEAKAQRHVFFAERKAAKVADLPEGTEARTVDSVGIVGAGTMGRGIAMAFADAGLSVTLVETAPEPLAKARDSIRDVYAKQAARGRIGAADAEARIGRIGGSTDLGDLSEADLVIEAVFEAMDVKRDVFAVLDSVAKPGAILATNTSTLDVNAIAAATGRPEDVIGLHFFSPANVMKLLEVVRADRTAPDVVQTAMSLAKRIGKVPVCVGVCDGFAGNRMFINFNREAQMLVEEGALPWEVDRVFTEFGLAMGPFAVMDLAGLDVGYRIRQARAAKRVPSDPYPFTTADRLAQSGRLGQKAGRGWYVYADDSRKGAPDPEVEALIAEVAAEKGIARRQIGADEILHRGLWQLVNTGGHILGEGIAQRASDLDVIFTSGYGFPRTKGGPMHYAESYGLARVVAEIEGFHAAHGAHWAPAPYLETRANEGRPLDG